MAVILEDLLETQFVTNRAGEKTAVIIPLGENSESFLKLLTDFIENRDYKNAGTIVSAQQAIQELEAILKMVDDIDSLSEVKMELENLMDLLEDKIDLHTVNERRSEPTIPHAELTKELRRDGLI